MKLWVKYLIFIGTISLLSGCMYPKDKLAENQIPYLDQLQSVQTAVDQFAETSGGLLPIKTRESETPLFIKYPIEFKKLVPQYMADAPGNAFENGGVYQYVLIDVEENPEVKVVDLRMAEKIREIKMRIQSQGYPPFKEKIADNVYSIDFERLGYKTDPTVLSSYTNSRLPFVITGDGELFVDYITDLTQQLQKESYELKEGEDIRHILYESSPVVPAYSLPYTIDENGEPIYMAK